MSSENNELKPGREGPTVQVKIYSSCYGCIHERQEYYCIEDGNDYDSGWDSYCNHPDAQKGLVRIGWGKAKTNSHAPDWCPLLEAATHKAVDIFFDKTSGIGHQASGPEKT